MKSKSYLPFFAVCGAFHMAGCFAHSVTPTLFKQLNLGSYMFGVAMAAMMIVQFFFSPVWGKLGGYLSSKVVLTISAFGYALGQMMFGFAKTELSFIIARMVAGIFTGGIMVSMLTYIVNTTEDEKLRGRRLTIIATLQSVGGAFGFLVGGLLGEISPYVAIGAQVLVLCTCGVLFQFVCTSDAEVDLKSIHPREIWKQSNPIAAFSASRSFITLTLLILFFMCALQNLGNVAFDQSFNYYIKDQFNFSSGYNGILKGLMGVITIIANGTICIWLVNKTDIRRSVIGVLGLCSAAMLGVVLLDDVIPFIVVFIIFFAFNAISIPLLQNIVSNEARGKDSNLIMGFYNSMKALGGIFGALFSGLFYTLNPKFPFVFGFTAFAVATVCGVVFARRAIREDSRKAA